MFGVPNSGALYRSLSYTVTSVADRVHTNKGFSRDVVIVTNPHVDIIARRAEDATGRDARCRRARCVARGMRRFFVRRTVRRVARVDGRAREGERLNAGIFFARAR
jgi:hypothetical protein